MDTANTFSAKQKEDDNKKYDKIMKDLEQMKIYLKQEMNEKKRAIICELLNKIENILASWN